MPCGDHDQLVAAHPDTAVVRDVERAVSCHGQEGQPQKKILRQSEHIQNLVRLNFPVVCSIVASHTSSYEKKPCPMHHAFYYTQLGVKLQYMENEETMKLSIL